MDTWCMVCPCNDRQLVTTTQGETMDIDACLAEVRRHVQRVKDTRGRAEVDALALAHAFTDLDEWLSRGGFAPAAWPCGADAA